MEENSAPDSSLRLQLICFKPFGQTGLLIEWIYSCFIEGRLASGHTFKNKDSLMSSDEGQTLGWDEN